MAQPNVSPSGEPGAELPTEAAYAAALPEILGVDDDDLTPINIDVVSAITTVLGVAPELKARRGEIEAELPRFDLARFDRLERYALALRHANTLHRSTLPSRANIAELGMSSPSFAIVCSRPPLRSSRASWWTGSALPSSRRSPATARSRATCWPWWRCSSSTGRCWRTRRR